MQDIKMKLVDIACICETWEVEGDALTAERLEEICEMDGYSCISAPRPRGKRGGGSFYNGKHAQV